MSRHVLLSLVALALLAACSDTVDNARGHIRGWCADNADWCDVNAVK